MSPSPASHHRVLVPQTPPVPATPTPGGGSGFTPEAAVEFLLKRTGRADGPGTGALALKLGYLPLALEQAAAYAAETAISFGDYLSRFRRSHNAMLKKGAPPPDDYPDTVLTTWQLSLQEARKLCPASADLLNLLAFLAPEAVPRWLLAEGGLTVVKRVCARQWKAGPAWTTPSPPWRRFSLLEATEQSLTVHRLVQAVA
ncbi:MAG: hypothetical protein HY681_02240 [Chloroflexi bacterium]|nr:hypothetical protein [Chloroflexota bacterium]